MTRRSKIIATLGPAVDTAEAITGLISEGLNVARLNFSHGTHQEHQKRMSLVREASEKLNQPVALLLDLSGPKVRTGQLVGKTAVVPPGDRVELIEGTSASYPQISINYEGFAAGLNADDRVLLDDGRIALRVVAREGDGVRCVVETPGELRDRVGVHMPARSIRSPTLTEKDQADLTFGLSVGVDYVGLSFVRSAEDIRQLRARCKAQGAVVPIVAKIETLPAVEDLDAIVQETDAVMVARGDLGVEFPPETVPVLQKRIIATAQRRGRPVIVATEMLHSMVHSERPTRAEASDVAHAVFDGADAVMLSAETAMGDHPSLAVRMMSRIVVQAEQLSDEAEHRPGTAHRDSVAESIAFNAADIAEEIGAKVLVAFTLSGNTARLVAQARPAVPLVAFAPSADTCRRMCLYWGVQPAVLNKLDSSDQMLSAAQELLCSQGRLKAGDRMVAVFGAPVGSGSETNSISVRIVR